MAEHRPRAHNEPTEDTPQDTEAPPATAVEPLLGFEDFLASTTLRPAAQAMLKRWMRQRGLSPDGHYALAQWQEYEAGMRAATS